MVTVAQLVEHWVVILVVAGSSPVGHTKTAPLGNTRGAVLMRGRDKDQYMANPTLREYLRDHPELEQRWSPSNKKSLLDLTTGSNKKAQWVCSTCGDEREYTINTVVKKPETCSVCSGRVIVVGVNYHPLISLTGN